MYYCKYVLVYTYMYWYTHICIPHPFSYIRQTHTRILALVDTCKYAFSVHTHTHGRTRIHSSLLYRHGVTLDHMRVCTHTPHTTRAHTHTHVRLWDLHVRHYPKTPSHMHTITDTDTDIDADTDSHVHTRTPTHTYTPDKGDSIFKIMTGSPPIYIQTQTQTQTQTDTDTDIDTDIDTDNT